MVGAGALRADNWIPGTMEMMNRYSGLPVLAVLMAVSAALALLFFPVTLEDAQITFRYSLRFSEGYEFGMWNRVGEPVEGFTTFLWMVYLSCFGPNIDAIVAASKFTGLFAHVSLVALFGLLFLRFRSSGELPVSLFSNRPYAARAFLLTATALSFFIPLAWYSTSGMEMPVFVLLIALVLFLPLLVEGMVFYAAVSIMLVLLRPDGLLFSVSAPLFYFFMSRKPGFLMVAGLAISAFLVLSVFRYFHFGYLMPNTYYAKSGGAGPLHWAEGASYVGSFLLNYCYLFVPVVVAFFKQYMTQKKAVDIFLLVSFLGVFAYLFLIGRSGGDNFSAFPMWRHGLNLFPLILFCGFYGAQIMSEKYGARISGTFLLLLLLGPVCFSLPGEHSKFLRDQMTSAIGSYPSLNSDYRNNELLLWLREISDENTIISTPLAGALPLTVDAVHIDVLGLNDEFIAHNGSFDPRGPIDSKTHMNYVMQQRPHIIEGYINASAVIKGEFLEYAVARNRSMMNMDLLLNPAFEEEYLAISNAPYEAMNRILFIRKDYFMDIGSAHGIEVMPVTSLVQAARLVEQRFRMEDGW